jgi:hypothetical protein
VTTGARQGVNPSDDVSPAEHSSRNATLVDDAVVADPP